VNECPARAISGERTVKVTIAGHEVEWGELDEMKCAIGWQAASPELNPFLDGAMADMVNGVIRDTRPKPERRAFGQYVAGRIREEFRYSKAGWESFHHPGAICGGRGCVRACMIHLEEGKKLANRFEIPFRIREPWRLPAAAQPV
jgi:hypothetical protein